MNVVNMDTVIRNIGQLISFPIHYPIKPEIIGPIIHRIIANVNAHFLIFYLQMKMIATPTLVKMAAVASTQ